MVFKTLRIHLTSLLIHSCKVVFLECACCFVFIRDELGFSARHSARVTSTTYPLRMGLNNILCRDTFPMFSRYARIVMISLMPQAGALQNFFNIFVFGLRVPNLSFLVFLATFLHYVPFMHCSSIIFYNHM